MMSDQRFWTCVWSLIFGMALFSHVGCGASDDVEVQCDNGTERTVSCDPFDHGLQQQLCVEYRWSNQTECLENAECIPSSVDDIQNCGKNDRGEKRRQCTRAGTWTDFSACDDPDECVDGESAIQTCGTQQDGVQRFECKRGVLEAVGRCEEPCQTDTVRAAACLNDPEKLQRHLCVDSTWIDDGACEAACTPGTKRENEVCGLNDRGVQTLLCTPDFIWAVDVPCNEGEECKDNDETDVNCGFEHRGLQHQRCDLGFWTNDGACEYQCEGSSSVDVPDIYGADLNCDGIDGDRARAIFVSPQGNDTNSGTDPDHPIQTIAEALLRVQDLGGQRNQILLTEGIFATSAPVILSDGVGLYGGYSLDFTERSNDRASTQIQSSASTALAIENATKQSAVQNLTIKGGPSTTASPVTYTLWVKNVPRDLLALENLHIIAGNGKNGSTGLQGANGAGTNATTRSTDGAIAACVEAGNGGDGGQKALTCDETVVREAAPGQPSADGLAEGGSAGTAGDMGGCNGAATPGMPGGRGESAGYPIGVASAFSAPTYRGDLDPHIGVTRANNVTGNAGLAGGGGGGGGGGGLYGVTTSYPNAAQGGGGGAGGCPGQPGDFGENGGSTVGLLLINAYPSLQDLTVTLGVGGQGGKGGDGGRGHAGGTGSAGTNTRVVGDKPGGTGGNGGASSGGTGGGGGAGGLSIGIAALNATPTNTTNVLFTGGQAGQGGAGGQGGAYGDSTVSTQRSPDGPDGPDGVRLTVWEEMGL